MDFKTFLIKRVMMSFCVTVTCICIAMAVLGIIFQPDMRFGYEAFLSPLIFGAVAVIPQIASYSRHELTLRQAAVRNVLHLIMLEILIVSVLSLSGMLTSRALTVSLALSILIIDLAVNLVLWLNDRNMASEFNSELKKLQNAAPSQDI